MAHVRPLVAPHDAAAVDDLWQVAQDRRRDALGMARVTYRGGLLTRSLTFGIGMEVDGIVVACALASPAREDDGFSARVVPGLVHVFGVATHPDHWGRGYAGRLIRGLICQADRRGFSRAQLWTYDTNDTAAHVYASAGFRLTGRHKAGDHGEPESQWMRTVEHPVVARAAARMLCLDVSGRILMQRYRDPVDGHEMWEPPGGGIEPGEQPIDAVLREWREETGLEPPQVTAGPVDVGRDVLWQGRRGVLSEQFFRARLDAEAPAPRPEAVADLDPDVYLGHAWVHPGRLGAGTFAGAFVDPDIPPLLDRLR